MERRIDTQTTLEGYFHELFRGALAAERIDLSDSAKAYVLQLVTEYAERDALHGASKKEERGTPALFWLYERAVTAPPHERFNAFRQMGDIALVVSGFFGPHIDRSLVDVSYYVQMGGTAYSQAATLSHGGAFRTVLEQLAVRFAKVVEVLTRVAEQTTLPVAKDLGALYERWVRNPSSQDLQRRLATSGVFPVKGLLEAV